MSPCEFAAAAADVLQRNSKGKNARAWLFLKMLCKGSLTHFLSLQSPSDPPNGRQGFFTPEKQCLPKLVVTRNILDA